jgi:hypothetical protein
LKTLKKVTVIIIDEDKWYKKTIHDVLSFGNWGVHQTSIDGKFTVYHLPTGFGVVHIKTKRYAKLLAKRLDQYIVTDWKPKKDVLNDFIDFFVEMSYKLENMNTSLSILQITDKSGLGNSDIPF